MGVVKEKTTKDMVYVKKIEEDIPSTSGSMEPDHTIPKSTKSRGRILSSVSVTRQLMLTPKSPEYKQQDRLENYFGNIKS
ncbi:hypothetical protein GWI33_003351 [Rhynchophorus ferrugineus]|uniref:Uncharacterized protein n=1 Tax=Rhynchophorus ferrugineus TaxID=354439 RepID=A0A834IUY5_RHYFE|nr:hypothetical protein GWI33_003351 [Rhynchophorus ferrugineus]